MKQIEPKDRLVFALDVPGREEAKRFANLLEGAVGCFKIGLELFIREGPEILKIIGDNSSADIFLDLKLHDIPATVRGALESAVSHQVRYITVHSCEGAAPLAFASEAFKSGLEVLAVTVLTSLAQETLPALGFRSDLSLKELALERALMAQKAGCSGVVCSGEEVERIKKACGENLKAVVPGIRPTWSLVPGDDQSRVTTPGQAVRKGADLIVVGRPIRKAPDPREAAQKIIEEMKTALSAG